MQPDHHLLDDRQQWILTQLAEKRQVNTNAVAEEFDVSVDTIRRDLRSLHDQGLLRRVHGGAVPLSPLSPSFSGRSADDSTERSQLADLVVRSLRAGQVIGLDAGTTTTEIAARLPQTLQVTIVTNNPAAAVVLADHPAASVVLLGGTVDLQWMATTGPATVDSIRNFHLDLAIVGACSFDATAGATTRSPNEVATKQAFIAAAATTVIPIESNKLSTVAPFHVADPTETDLLVTASALDSAVQEKWHSAGIRVLTDLR